MYKRFSLILTAVLLPASWPALSFADSPFPGTAFVDQIPSSGAPLQQNGIANAAFAEQQAIPGGGNMASLQQTGQGGITSITQVGQRNAVAITQYGIGGKASTSQYGTNPGVQADQYGNSSPVLVQQSGTGRPAAAPIGIKQF